MSVADQKTATQLNQLEQIKRFTTVVADTADFESIRQFKKFRYLFNEDAMATEKTAEGIRKFAADIGKLEKFVAGKLR